MEKFNPHSPDCKIEVEDSDDTYFESHYGVENLYKKDMVNNPPHYTQYEGFEVIDVTKQLDFLYGNAVKYILRAPFKGDEKQDIAKAIWYLELKLEEMK